MSAPVVSIPFKTRKDNSNALEFVTPRLIRYRQKFATVGNNLTSLITSHLLDDVQLYAACNAPI